MRLYPFFTLKSPMNNPIFFSSLEDLNKLWYIYILEYSAAIKEMRNLSLHYYRWLFGEKKARWNKINKMEKVWRVCYYVCKTGRRGFLKIPIFFHFNHFYYTTHGINNILNVMKSKLFHDSKQKLCNYQAITPHSPFPTASDNL